MRALGATTQCPTTHRISLTDNPAGRSRRLTELIFSRFVDCIDTDHLLFAPASVGMVIFDKVLQAAVADFKSASSDTPSVSSQENSVVSSHSMTSSQNISGSRTASTVAKTSIARCARSAHAARTLYLKVKSRTGAVVGPSAPPRFPSPLIKPDVRISRIRLSDWLHLATVGGAPMCIRRSRSTPSFPKTTWSENCRVPREGTLCRRVRKPRTAS